MKTMKRIPEKQQITRIRGMGLLLSYDITRKGGRKELFRQKYPVQHPPDTV